MSNFTINKKTIVWSYLAQGLSIFSGIIILPFLLTRLSAEEIGLYYILLTATSFVSLLDFGFAPQLGRNLTYVFNGAQNIKTDGVGNVGKSLNKHLLATLIASSRDLYKFITIIVLLILLTIGVYYIQLFKSPLLSFDYLFTIWLLHSFSIGLNMYFAYYSAFLNGKGMVYEHRKIFVYSKVVSTILTLFLVFSGFGLYGIAISNVVGTILTVLMSRKAFFTLEILIITKNIKVLTAEKITILKLISKNAGKLGLLYIGNFAVSRISLLICASYLTLRYVGSYGLLVQILGLITVVSTNVNALYQPRFASLQIDHDKAKTLAQEISYTIIVFIVVYIFAVIMFLFFGQRILDFVGAPIDLPSKTIVFIYSVVIFLENLHSLFYGFFLSRNEFPFLMPVVISGLLIVLLTFLMFEFHNYGLVGLILIQGIVQLSYNNWKWPAEVFRALNLNVASFFNLGAQKFSRKLFYIHYFKK